MRTLQPRFTEAAKALEGSDSAIKDLKASTQPNFALTMDPTEAGTGEQDWAKILPAAEAAGVVHYYVEQEPPFAMPRIESARRSFAYLSELRA